MVSLRGAVLLVMAIVCLVSPAPLWAESAPLTLAQIVEISLQNNGALQSFREEQGIVDAGKIRAGLRPNPTLELEGGTGALTGSGAENGLSLGLSQEIVLAGKRGKRVTVAERAADVYRFQVADRERELRQEVQTAVYDLLLAGERVALTDRSISLNRQLLDVAGERLAAGDIPELEMNLVRVEVARSEGAGIDIAQTFSQSQAKLLTLMGLPADTPLSIAEQLETVKTRPQSVVELKRLALERRPDLKALEAEQGRADADISLAQAEGLPNPTVGLALKRDTTAMEIGGVEGKDTAYTIGFSLSMPLPVFDSNQAGVREARARRSSNASRLTAAIRTVEQDVEIAYTSVLNAEKVLSLYKTNVIPQLEENLKLTQEAYRLGEVGIHAVIQEQIKFFEVREGYLAALHDRQTALVKLESAVSTEFTGGVQ